MTDSGDGGRGLIERAESEPESLSDNEILWLFQHNDRRAHRALPDALERIAAQNPDRAARFLDEVKELFRRNDSETRRDAIEILEAIARHDPDSTDAMIDTLRRALQDDDPAIRAVSADALSVVIAERPEAVEETIPALRSLLGAEHAHLREKAVEIALALARRRPENASLLVPELLDLIADRSEEDPIESTSAGPIHGTDQLGEWRSRGRQEQVKRRARAAVVLSAVADARPGAVADHVLSIVDCYEAEDWPRIRASLIEGLVGVTRGRPEAVEPALPTLIDALDDDYEPVRSGAALACVLLAERNTELVANAVEPAIDSIVDLLAADDADSRSIAAGLLSYVADERPVLAEPATDPLTDLLEDDKSVRRAAIWALAGIGTDRAMEALREARTSDHDGAAQAALDSLDIDPSRS